MFDALRDFVEPRRRTAALLLVIEESALGIDESSLALLRHLVQRRAGVPCLACEPIAIPSRCAHHLVRRSKSSCVAMDA